MKKNKTKQNKKLKSNNNIDKYLNKNNINIQKNDEKKFFLYSNLNKNIFKKIFVIILASKWINIFVSFYLKSFFSCIHINKIIKKNNINLNLFEKNKFKSYNDFFIRKYKKIYFEKNPFIFISPGEGKICIYHIKQNSVFTIKEINYHLSDLLKNQSLANEYENGYCVILRLRPIDYHRYIFIDDGFKDKKNYIIKGKFHTVRPIAFKYFNVFKENSREYNILRTKNFGKIIQIEIGALLVGKINNYPLTYFRKGQEKGFFSYGGSTIVLLVKKNNVFFNEEILINSQNNKETQVQIGQKIGFKILK